MLIYITLEFRKNILDSEKKFMCAGNYTENSISYIKIILNPKSFWNYIKNRIYNNYIPSVMEFNNAPKSSRPEISELFKDYFCSVYADDTPDLYNFKTPLN